MARMEHEETYHGKRIIITTLQHKTGGWESKADLLDSGKRIPLWRGSDVYLTEEEARLAALSAAAGAIDRTRISKGKS